MTHNNSMKEQAIRLSKSLFLVKSKKDAACNVFTNRYNKNNEDCFNAQKAIIKTLKTPNKLVITIYQLIIKRLVLRDIVEIKNLNQFWN